MKKLLPLFLAALMTVSFIAGCGTTNQTEDPTTPTSGGNPTNPVTPTTPATPVPGGTVTRADLQAAVAELGWDYYIKGDWVQYDSMDLNSRTDGLQEPLSRWLGGHTRLDHFATSTPENATMHDTLYSVCSDFVWDVYYQALGYPIMGSSLNASTWYMWQYGENPSDMMVVRWHTWAENTNSTETEDGYVTHDKCLTYDELYAYMSNWKENLQTGDIIVWPGHAMLYVGNGYVLDCRGGKYSMTTGTDAVEVGGAIWATTVEDLFFNHEEKDKEDNYFYMEKLKERTTSGQFCILRPLDLLTADDGDGNPANDVLDTEYVLDLGKQIGNFDFDPNTVVTSGFTIQESTYSRLKYPLMNINRTVDISSYGTAVQGDTITYTVAITNGTTDDSYMDWMIKGGNSWPFKLYKDVVVLETIPENTTLVSAPDAEIDGNTLRWVMDIPAGQTVELTYTVKVTGKIGDQIVNGGGWVDNIPSNTIVNTIGGNKLNIETTRKMWNFFYDGKDLWNSNNGYKISAAAGEGTRFAERLYNELVGVDLQLPDVQELMDMLYTQTLIEIDGGMGGYYNKKVSKYMYTLNEKTPRASDQIYRDMVVNTFYGGVWVFSNPYIETPRTVDIRIEDLEPGDILVMANLASSESRGAAREDREVTRYKVVVYLGNKAFAELTHDGRLAAKTGDVAITSIYTYDLFVVLRPSQVYSDIYTDVPAYVGPAKDLTEKDKAYKYILETSNVLLNDELSQQLASLTVDGCKMQNGTFIGEIYLKLKIDVVYNGTNDASYATFMKNVFMDIGSGSAAYQKYGHEYHLLSEPIENYEALYEMLLYYGGPTVVTKNEITSLSQLHPGDVIMTGLRNQRYYTVAIYQGDGKFLGHSQALSGTIFKESYTWYPLSFDSDTAFMSWLTGAIQPENFPNVVYEAYVVLRPSRAFDDINAMQLRDIADGPLTKEETDRLAAITPDDRQKVTWHMNETAPWLYSMAYIDLSPYLDKTCYRTMEQIFVYGEDGWEVIQAGKPGYNLKYRAMLVDGYYGGTEFATSKTFTAADFEIGDLFCAFKPAEDGNGNRYYVAMYQGNGKFLMGDTSGDLYVDRTTVFSSTLATDFSGYYVLRPSQISTYEEVVIESGRPLTEDEKNAIAALEPSAIKNKVWTVNQVAPLVYQAAYLDISSYFGTNPMYGKALSNYWIGETLFRVDSDGYRVLRPNNYNGYMEHCATMLIDGYYGGTAFATSKTFTAADFEIGDIFCGYAPASDNASKNLYFTAIYQGNGVFLTADGLAGTSADNYSYVYEKNTTTIFADDIGTTFTMYYVLRPSRLLTEDDQMEKPVPGQLTSTEKQAIAALTADSLKNKAWLVNSLAVEVYKAAGLDVSAYFGSTTHGNLTNVGMFNSIFRYEKTIDGYQVRPNNYNGYIDYCHDMLVEGYYGGTNFIEQDRRTFTADDFEIGDLFCGWKPASDNASKNVYYTAVYQGNGVFLAIDQTDSTSANSYAYEYGTDTTTVFDVAALAEFTAYYVLRPSQIIR